MSTTERQMTPDALSALPSLDRTARRAWLALVVVGGLLAAGAVYSVLAGSGWLAAALTMLAVLLVAGLYDRVRAKNIAWRAASAALAADANWDVERGGFATGKGQLGEHSYLGLRTFASPRGIEVARIVAAVNRPLTIPWNAIAKVDTFPSLLTGRKEFETDLQARIVLRNHKDLTLEVPWLREFRAALPKAVKYRAIKLSKK